MKSNNNIQVYVFRPEFDKFFDDKRLPRPPKHFN